MTDGPKRPPPGDSKICGVCGDKALGYNFNAITCESCKAFFRRNALKSKEFKCPFSDTCKVDVVTRRFCQKCRLKKCVEIGMKKEWIMTDEEKKVKKQKIEENRQKRHTTTVTTDATSSTTPTTCSPASTHDERCSPTSATSDDPVELVRVAEVKIPPPPPPPRKSSNSNSHVIDVDILTPTSEERSSSECDGSLASPVVRDILSPLSSSKVADDGSPCSVVTSEGLSASPGSEWRSSYRLLSPSPCTSAASNASSLATSPQHASPSPSPSQQDATVAGVFDVAIKSELRPVESCPLSPTGISGGAQHLPSPSAVSYVAIGSPATNDLAPSERATIDELMVANRAMKKPITDGDRFRKSVDPSLINVINLTDIAIRRLIKMSKRIAAFRRLCQEDQIALLKGSCTELMILRSVMTYNPENECWLGPRGPGRLGGELMRIKLEVLREAKGNIYEEHKRFIQSFDINWRTDENVMLLLGAITLFEPHRPNVVHADAIRAEQDAYYTLLRRYLESVYSSCEARSAYLKLVQRIDELHLLNENHVRVYLDVNPKEVEPLLIEIFDLKNH